MSDNEKALIAAAGAGNVEEIRRLKNLGTNLDAVTATKYAEDMQDAGTSALWVACWFGQAQAVDALAELGADTKKGDEGGRSPLYAAAFRGKGKVVELLVKKYKEDVNQVRAATGASIVWVAAYNGHNDTITLPPREWSSVMVSLWPL